MALAKRPFQANHASTDDDPLEKVLQPPPDESPAERARREQEQREAQRVSLEIDEGIQEAKKLYDRRKKAVKILLLGASLAALPVVRIGANTPPRLSRSSRVGQEHDFEK